MNKTAGFWLKKMVTRMVKLSDMSSLTAIPTVQHDSERISLQNTQATCFPLGLLNTQYFNFNKSLTLSVFKY